MDVTFQIARDHAVDLSRVLPDSANSATFQPLLIFVPVEFRGGSVKFCFIGRSDVTILREGARSVHPPQSSARSPARFSNLVMTLRAGDVVKGGLGLMDLKLLTVDRGRATIKATMLVDHLLLRLEPLGGSQERSVRDIIDRLNRGEDYRSDAL
jgi:hypothetical protein